MVDVRVTAELRHLDTGEWEAYAYGGDIVNPTSVRISRPTPDEVKADFVGAWNTAAATSYDPAEFVFVVQD